jgi:O-antigen ligase
VINVIPWGQVTIGLAVAAFFILGERGRGFHPMDGMVILFTFWVFATIPFAWSPEFAIDRWASMASWMIMYFLVSHVVVTSRRMLLFWAGMMVVFLKMSQHGARTWALRGFSFEAYGVTGSPVWFQNSGEFAMGMVMFVAMSWCVLVAIRPYVSGKFFWIGAALLPLTAIMSVLASSSRGGQIAGLVVIALLVAQSRLRFRALAMAAVVLAIGWAVLPPEQKARFAVMGSAEDETGQARLTHWGAALETIQDRPIFGVGYENWLPYYATQNPIFVQEIHNTFLEAPVELGIPGALMFFGMIAGTFVMNARTRRRVRPVAGPWGDIFNGMAKGLDISMVGLLVASIFMSVLFWPVYWMSFALSVALSETSRRMALRVPQPVRNPRVARMGGPAPALARLGRS